MNQAIVSGDLQQLLHSLQCEDTRLNAIHPDNVQWYMDVLSKAIKDKAEVDIMFILSNRVLLADKTRNCDHYS